MRWSRLFYPFLFYIWDENLVVMGLKVIMSTTWWVFFFVCLSCVCACPCKRCLCNPILLMEMDCWRISNLSIPFSNSYAHKQVGPALTQLSLLPSVVKQEPWSLPKVGKQPPSKEHRITHLHTSPRAGGSKQSPQVSIPCDPSER